MFRSVLIVIAAMSLPVAHSWAADLPLTPAQTEGPYYPVAKPADTDADLTRIGLGPQAKGEVLVLDGKVLDPSGKPFQERTCRGLADRPPGHLHAPRR